MASEGGVVGRADQRRIAERETEVPKWSNPAPSLAVSFASWVQVAPLLTNT